MSVYKRGRFYWVKIHDRWNGGPPIRISTKQSVKSAALEYERGLIRDLEKQYISGTVRMPFSQATVRFLEEHVSTLKEQTAKRYVVSLRALRPCFEPYEMTAITRSVIDGYVMMRRRAGVGGAGIRHDLAVLSKMFSKCVHWGYLQFNILRDYDKSSIPKRNERVRSLTTKEETKLYSILDGQDERIITLAIESGMREGEILSTRHSFIGDDEISIPESKSNRPRVVPLTNRARAQIRAQPRHITLDLLFYTANGTKMTVENYSHHFGRLVKKARIKDFRFHDLRHTFATRYLKNGGKLERLQAILGHSTINQTMKYAHVVTEDLHEDMKATEKRRAQKRAQRQGIKK